MKYETQLIGLPVIDRITGELLGALRRLVCQTDKKRMQGIIYEERGWMRRCHFIPWQSITSIGDRSIVIDSAAKHRAARNDTSTIRENQVFTSEGNYVGRVSNFIIDERNGAILGMELSASVIDDLKFGRKIIENTGNIMKAEDFLMLVNSEEPGNTEQNERRSEDEGLY